MESKSCKKPSISLLVSCSIFKEQFLSFLHSVEQSAHVEQVELFLIVRKGYAYRSLVAGGFWQVHQMTIEGSEALNDARAGAVVRAQGDIVVFAEDHTQLNGPWVETLLRLYADSRISAVGWTIQPGRLKTITSWSGFLVEYGWWGPGVTSGAPVTHLPGHNSSYRRDRLLAYGADLNRLMLAEAFLHWDLTRQGDLLYFTTEIHSVHFEPYTLRELWLADFWYGWNFADTRQTFARWGYGKRLLFAAAIWLKPLVRWWELLRIPRQHAFYPPGILWRCAVPITLTFFLSTLGECLGHLFGSAGAAKQLEEYELATNRRVER
ncbi:MAG TPA: hypothetical protein PK843_05590 [bacterium]|mgnify:CR=1 FL=1|nr:hypothetical protein [bacterium]